MAKKKKKKKKKKRKKKERCRKNMKRKKKKKGGDTRASTSIQGVNQRRKKYFILKIFEVEGVAVEVEEMVTVVETVVKKCNMRRMSN
jgi:microsomal dipeptidase-like Zn-dependent dipeptidase